MPKKIPKETMKRLFRNIYVCMKCNAKIRANPQKVREGKIHCRKCGYTGLRKKSSESRGI